MDIWSFPTLRINLLVFLSSFNASIMSSSERPLIALMVSSVTSACHLGCAQRPSIPFRCSSFASVSLCATHIAVPGVVIFLWNLLWKLWRISGTGFDGSFPSANIRFFWLFCLLVSQLVRYKSRLVPRLSGRCSNDSELGSLFRCWLPVLGSSGGEAVLSFSPHSFSDSNCLSSSLICCNTLKMFSQYLQDFCGFFH